MNSDSLLVYIKWVVSLENESFNESIKELISLSINMCDTEEQYKDIVGIMDSMKKEQFKTCSKKYLVPIVNLLGKTTSVELKKKIFDISKKLRLSKDVLKYVSEPLHDELKE